MYPATGLSRKEQIEKDIFEQRLAMDEEARQDAEDKYGAMNQEGLFPHEVSPRLT